MDLNKILDKTENLQTEMHKFIEDAIQHAWETKKKRLTYQDVKDVYYLMKISELKEEINKIR